MIDLSSLTDAELLAFFTTGENELDFISDLLTQYDGLRGMMRITAEDLQKIEGLDDVSATKILAITELGKRLLTYLPDERPTITSAIDAAQLVTDMADLRQEHVRVILLDLTRRVIAIPTIYIGTLNASVLRTAEVFREAITRNAPAMILVHNHPAGDSSPSPEDVELTHTLMAAARLLDIILVDHLIVSQGGWSSLKEMGLAFNSSG
jgi:DNA repair protein RadC